MQPLRLCSSLLFTSYSPVTRLHTRTICGSNAKSILFTHFRLHTHVHHRRITSGIGDMLQATIHASIGDYASANTCMQSRRLEFTHDIAISTKPEIVAIGVKLNAEAWVESQCPRISPIFSHSPPTNRSFRAANASIRNWCVQPCSPASHQFKSEKYCQSNRILTLERRDSARRSEIRTSIDDCTSANALLKSCRGEISFNFAITRKPENRLNRMGYRFAE